MNATKLTPEIARALCEARRGGASQEESAGSVGIPARYIRRWREQGRGGKEPFATFARLWDQAGQDNRRDAMDAIMRSYNSHAPAAQCAAA